MRDASAAGVGVLAKRPLGNAAWRFERAPDAPDVRTYWERAQALRIDPAPLSWPELALRFAAHASGVSAALAGTSSAAHLAAAVDAVTRGPLDEAAEMRLRDAWTAHATAEWRGVV